MAVESLGPPSLRVLEASLNLVVFSGCVSPFPPLFLGVLLFSARVMASSPEEARPLYRPTREELRHVDGFDVVR